MPPDQLSDKGIVIFKLLPNPKGTDAGNEEVALKNHSPADVDLAGWKLVDQGGNSFLLSGTISAGAELLFTMKNNSMPLNNDGDTVSLIDPDSIARNRVSYKADEVRSGDVIRFGK